jgi:hypothetical protein
MDRKGFGGKHSSLFVCSINDFIRFKQNVIVIKHFSSSLMLRKKEARVFFPGKHF